jgi:hypothetical protein
MAAAPSAPTAATIQPVDTRRVQTRDLKHTSVTQTMAAVATTNDSVAIVSWTEPAVGSGPSSILITVMSATPQPQTAMSAAPTRSGAPSPAEASRRASASEPMASAHNAIV